MKKKTEQKNKQCTYCSPINEEIVEVHENPSGLFGVGLLVEVSVEVAQLKIDSKQIIKVLSRLRLKQKVQECRRKRGLATGAGSNWEITWWRKAARWAGRDLSCSMLLKLLHWPFG